MINLLDLQDKMHEMHLTTNTIADYIEVLKDTQRKAKWAKNPVRDEYLVIVATHVSPKPETNRKTPIPSTKTGRNGRRSTSRPTTKNSFGAKK